jgi:hypothetical protein
MFDLNYYRKICRFGKVLNEIEETNKGLGMKRTLKEYAGMNREQMLMKVEAEAEQHLLVLNELKLEHYPYLIWYENYNRIDRHGIKTRMSMSDKGFNEQKKIYERKMNNAFTI